MNSTIRFSIWKIDRINYVIEEFDVEYTNGGMRSILSTLNFVYKKPEKIPFRVDKKAQKKFISEYMKLRKKLTAKDGLYFMDATHPEHSAIPSYGWIKRGETKALKSNPRPYSLNTIIKFEEKINKETTLDFLEALRKYQPQGWIYLICDNAGYYTSPDVKAYAKIMAIKLLYLPPYSPNLNLMELKIFKLLKLRKLAISNALTIYSPHLK